jgi:Raf kinase inhibitor-like YbhB/YbcL family protein
MKLSSSAFNDDTTIPKRYTCEGQSMSPPLTWSDAPSGTKSFVILCEDPDAPGGTFKHWAAYNIPADTTSVSGGVPQKASAKGFEQAKNDFDDIGYGAPCPPPGDDAHRYRFHVWALDVDRLNVSGTPDYDAIKSAARKHRIGQATLTGRFER